MTSPNMCSKLYETENAPKNTKTYGVAPHKNKTMIGFFSPVIVFSLCFRKRYGEDVEWRRKYG